MTTIKEQITQWREDLLAPQSDVLLNLIEDKNALLIQENYIEEKPFFIPENAFLKKCYKQHQQHIKETGSPIFGMAKDLLLFHFDNLDYRIPFLLASSEIKKNRFNQYFKIQQTEDFYVNPLLSSILKVNDISIDIDEAVKNLSELGLEISIEKGFWAANFHPHRFVLQKEYDELLNLPELSNSLKNLFGEEESNSNLSLSTHYLFPADESQINAIKAVESQNTVVQGPPGTGKSQVIANLIGKAVGNKKSVLLVAEKSVALQVIYDQLKKKHLHHFCAFYHHELKSKFFVKSLYETWKYLESLPQKNIIVNQQHEFLKHGLDLTLSRLRQKDLIGGISFSEFHSKFKLAKKSTYLTEKPSIPIWQKDKVILEQLEKNNFPIYGSWLNLKINKHAIKDIENAINQILNLLKKSSSLTLNTNELKRSLKLSGLVSLFYYNDQTLPIELFESKSKKQKQFLKYFKILKTLTEKEDFLKIEEKNWRKNFSLSELQEYITALASTNRFNLRSSLTRRKLLKFTDLNLVEGKKALENLMELNLVRREIIDTKEKLRKADIPEDLPILEYINYAITKVNATDQNEIQTLLKLSKKERLKIKNATLIYSEINHFLNTFFNLNEYQSIVEQLEELQKNIPLLVENISRVEKIDIKTKSALRKTNSLKTTEEAIFNSHQKDFKGLFPSLAEISGENIQSKIESILQSFNNSTEEYSQFIQQQIKSQFENYHVLLQTPSTKLSETEKEFKKELRKGKSILVKAFDKKRVFPSVRELLESEAKHWVQILHPIFLCSPYSVAKSLPINFTFDLGVFDEASQIPLNHIIGSVQRAKRVVISGDQQQMPPQFYFKKKSQSQSDALHHTSFYWKNVFLTYHYRSNHPALIAFSNRYFYENKLKVFPSINTNNPIELITTNGVFYNRKNEKEAEIVANMIVEKVKNNEFNFGLVAFSQTQLNTILDKIPATVLNQLEEKNTVFVQSLENIQGDQCEHLIISLGYAKDENGTFHLRFGPLNQEQGHRRLNVLMSRAIAKITFIRSITSEDFSISNNEGVESLRKLMLFLEEEPHFSDFNFPADIQQKKNTLLISDISNTFQNAQEIIDFYRISIAKGWNINITV